MKSPGEDPTALRPGRGAGPGVITNAYCRIRHRSDLEIQDTSADSPPYVDTQLRIRYVETDQMGVAHHASYLTWFEVGRTELLRRRGFRYRDVERDEGILLAVAEARCRYSAALYYDDEVIVRTRVMESRRRFLTFHYQILRTADGKAAAEGETRHVVLGRDRRPRSLPDKYLKALEVDSAG